MIECYDTADLQFRGGVPDNAQSIIFYVDGLFANGTAARRRFPHLFNTGRAIGLTVFQRVPAEGDDFEPGNAMHDTGDWVGRSHATGTRRPIVYMDGSDWTQLVRPSLERKFGRPLPPPGPNRPFRTILAAPDGVRSIPPEHDGKQYWWSSIQGKGRSDMDISVLRDDFFAGAPTARPAAPKPHPAPQPSHPPLPKGATVIATYVTHNGRVGIAAETSTGEVLHIEQQAPDSDWWRNHDGSPRWLSLGTPGKK